MTVAIQGPQDTDALPVSTGPLTVPLQIIAAAGARHRAAVAERRALPAWALLTITIAVPACIGLATWQWHGLTSVLLIAAAVIGAGCAFALDVLNVVQHAEEAS